MLVFRGRGHRGKPPPRGVLGVAVIVTAAHVMGESLPAGRRAEGGRGSGAEGGMVYGLTQCFTGGKDASAYPTTLSFKKVQIDEAYEANILTLMK